MAIKDLQWQDGLVTLSRAGHDMKRNFEAVSNNESFRNIGNTIMGAIQNDMEFNLQAVTWESNYLLVSKTIEGGYYRAHHDHWTLGDYSTTVFLNDDYEGGELCIGDEQIKLPAGYAFSYETGTPHLVNPVTKGERYAAVFWTKSMFRDPALRSAASDLTRAVELMGISKPDSIEETKLDPSYLVRSALMQISRRYGRTS